MSEPTKAELTERLDLQAAELRELRADRDEWRTARARDDEAEAVAGCVRALDALKSRRGLVNENPSGGSYRRVLRFLADRYGVTWYEPPAEPTFPSPTPGWPERGLS